MNIMHTGDWHLGKTIEGHSRLPEQELFLNDLVSICEEKQPDMIIIAGDIYDTFNPPAAAEQLFYSTVKKLSRNGDCMVIVIAGNHDNPERLTAAASVLMLLTEYQTMKKTDRKGVLIYNAFKRKRNGGNRQ